MDLVAIEEIRRLKHRYLRSLDLKRWEEFALTLAVDATADYGTPVYGDRLSLAGREEIVTFMSRRLGPEVITVHFAGQPEIDIDGDEATGTWNLLDTVIATERQVVIQGAAFYEDRYRRDADGVWRISHTGYDRTYEAMFALTDLPGFRLTANRWAAAR
ncbi:nuclear transport factor 2 family protein [Kutzneria sp. CA-103260]|uniref:nuclear transport factor 2 family protein n=1 Tax=Kutzneria sp. CA-103260 TaxID=2802641 RepID=UPI001BABDFA5|nr:nuclear transport factor 2 family protein [Kutzneria sp. CA-103260]QUQ64217.1 Bile acid 7-alpha dehydratase [Kutzneria sp. CA-103260]